MTTVIAAGLAASLWFWRDADAQRDIAEKAATEAKTAEMEARAAQAREKSARGAAEANLANFNRLSHVVRLETAKAEEEGLYPAWPAKSHAMRSWLDGDAKGLVAALPELRATLAYLEARAIPQSDEEKAAARSEHPRAAELAALQNKLTALQRARDVRSAITRPAPFALDEATLPKTHGELNALAWPLVDPDRTTFGREAEGLALARRAVSVAPESGDDRAKVTDTLAWALFANGLDDEALKASEAAMNAAGGFLAKFRFTGYTGKLRKAIEAASGREGQSALASLAEKVAALDAEVSTRTSWRFGDDADSFLHSTLRRLVADIAAFEQTEVAAVRQRFTWSERVEELTITRYAEQWDEARLAILKADGVTASKLYGEVPIELIPQMGLVPLGMNPKTELWEFYHLRSAWDGASDPAEIAIPAHREDDSIEVTQRTGIVFVLLPGSTFWMGAQKSDPTEPNCDEQAQRDETPREIEISPFLLARHEITQGQWARLWSGDESLRHPSTYGPGFRGREMAAAVNAAHPVEQVDWSTSNETLARHGLVLPTEAQWEYGCRGTTTTPYSFAFADLKEFANVADATAKRAGVPWICENWSDGHIVHAPVGTFGANRFGLYDVHGNVWEWCKDLYGSASDRVARGGGFSASAVMARSAQRTNSAPTFRSGGMGLRPARTLRLRD